MSIAALQETATELRRLSIAGSGLSKDDFRLKRIVPALRKSGQKAAVFATIADAIDTLLNGSKRDSAAHLLRATTLVHAVLATQLRHQVEGTLEPLQPSASPLANQPIASKTLRTIVEALTSTGSGRLEVVQEAHRSGHFLDLRLLRPALRSFDDPYPELAEFMEKEVLPLYGSVLLPFLQRDFDRDGGAAHVRRLRVMLGLLDDEERLALCVELAESSSKEMRAAAAAGLKGLNARDVVLSLCSDRAKEVRAAAYPALSTQDDGFEPLVAALSTKDGELAAPALAASLASGSHAHELDALIGQADAYLAGVLEKKKGHHLARLLDWIRALAGDSSGQGFAFLLRVSDARAAIQARGAATKRDLEPSMLFDALDMALATSGDAEATTMLLAHLDLRTPIHAFEACLRTRDAAFVFETFHSILLSSRRRDREELVNHIVGGYDGSTGPERASWDPRWLDVALKRNERRLVFALLMPEHHDAMRFVVHVAQTPNEGDGMAAIKALKAAGYSEWSALLNHRIRAHAKGASSERYWAYHYFLQVFPFDQLSLEALSSAEKLAGTLKGSIHDAFTNRLAEERFRRRASPPKGNA